MLLQVEAKHGAGMSLFLGTFLALLGFNGTKVQVLTQKAVRSFGSGDTGTSGERCQRKPAVERRLSGSVIPYADVCSHMLMYAHVCSRMLTYAHVCSRMLTYAQVVYYRRQPWHSDGYLLWFLNRYADVC
jgi:hypothetical protein